MLTCIACPKQLNNNDGSVSQHGDDNGDDIVATPSKKLAIKTLTTQIKGMAIKASGACKICKPCSGGRDSKGYEESEEGKSGSTERYNRGYKRVNSMAGIWGKHREIVDPRVVAKGAGMGLLSGEGTPVSVSGRTEDGVFMEEDEPKEWVAQVEPGVLITFVSVPHGGNDLKRIRFSRELFNKWQAQRWWAENYDKVMELYNVQKFDHNSIPMPIPPRSEDENSKGISTIGSPTTPPLSKESLPRHLHRPTGTAYSPSYSLDHHTTHQYYESSALTSTPKLSNISGIRTETSSVDASNRSSFLSRADHSGELSVSNASDVETEWVEQDEDGVYITIRALSNGTRELRRVRFSRDRFGERHARLWWEENKARIQEQYL